MSQPRLGCNHLCTFFFFLQELLAAGSAHYVVGLPTHARKTRHVQFRGFLLGHVSNPIDIFLALGCQVPFCSVTNASKSVLQNARQSEPASFSRQFCYAGILLSQPPVCWYYKQEAKQASDSLSTPLWHVQVRCSLRLNLSVLSCFVF